MPSDSTPQYDPAVEYAKGSWQKRLKRDELAEKFRECAGLFLEKDQVDPLFEKLWNIEKIGDLREIALS